MLINSFVLGLATGNNIPGFFGLLHTTKHAIQYHEYILICICLTISGLFYLKQRDVFSYTPIKDFKIIVLLHLIVYLEEYYVLHWIVISWLIIAEVSMRSLLMHVSNIGMIDNTMWNFGLLIGISSKMQFISYIKNGYVYMYLITHIWFMVRYKQIINVSYKEQLNLYLPIFKPHGYKKINFRNEVQSSLQLVVMILICGMTKILRPRSNDVLFALYALNIRCRIGMTKCYVLLCCAVILVILNILCKSLILVIICDFLTGFGCGMFIHCVRCKRGTSDIWVGNKMNFAVCVLMLVLQLK